MIFLALLALCGAASSVAMAGPLDPIGTVTSAISTIAGQTTVLPDLPGGGSGSGSGSGGSGSGATDVVSGAVGSVTGSAAGLLSGSGSAGTGGTAGSTSTSGSVAAGGSSGGGSGRSRSSGGSASGTRAHTRFDRLPHRYERLLERIELGRNVRASITRLRELLASSSPAFRARVLLLIRHEIHRLEKGGVTRRERMAIRRLHRVLNALHVRAAPAPVPKTTSVASSERPGVGTTVTGGVLGASDSQPRAADQTRSTNARRAGGEGGGLPFVPPAPPSSALYWLLVALFGTMICALLLLGLSSQRPRPVPLRGIAAALAPQLKALGLMMAFVGGLLIYLLILLA